MNSKDDGYRGIWSCNGSAVSDDEHKIVHFGESIPVEHLIEHLVDVAPDTEHHTPNTQLRRSR